ncbi:GyrI-like domain-containing protein [Agromyces sp. MMS24-JH15]|uniref:GyrI-like domain-containing protein n=1 Tax=Agromyces sp. MMS24-JH15 TaxID=3243765 RepID=UPI003749CF28
MADLPWDVKRVHPECYAPRRGADFALVEVPPIRYLAIDGHGNPNSAPAYAAALGALYPVAYTLKFTGRREHGRDAVVAPLEALWRADDPGAFVARDKSAWSWTVLIAQPDWVDEASVDAAVAAVRVKKRPDAPLAAALDGLRLERMHEGLSAQILHVGSYDDEAPTLARLHDEWMPERGLAFAGDHHEIYLGDPRRVAPEKLRTILRQPVRTA